MSCFLDSHALLESPTVIELRIPENARNFAFRDLLTDLYKYRFLRDYLPREIVLILPSTPKTAGEHSTRRPF